MPVVPFIPLITAGVGAAGAIASSNASNRGQQQAANASQQASDAAIAEQRRQYDQSRTDQAPWLQTGTSALNTLAGLYGLGGGQQGGGAPAGFNEQAYLAANPDVAASVGGGGFGGSGYNHWLEYGRTENRQGGPMGAAGATGAQAPFYASPDYQFRQSEAMRALTARNAALGIQNSGAAQRSALTLAGNQAAGEFNNYANRLSALAGVGQSAANQNAAAGQNFAGAVGQIGMNNAQNLASSYTNRANTSANLYGGLAGQAGSALQWLGNRYG